LPLLPAATQSAPTTTTTKERAPKAKTAEDKHET